MHAYSDLKDFLQTPQRLVYWLVNKVHAINQRPGHKDAITTS